MVPHDVPVANAMKHAMIMKIAGNMFLRLPASSNALLTNDEASRLLVMAQSVHAKIRMRIADTMLRNPWGSVSKSTGNAAALRTMKYAMIMSRATIDPIASPVDALALANASRIPAPLKNPPV